MSFVVEKDNGLIPQILSAILDECVNGVTLADPDLEGSPIVYANKAFERLTGYSQEEIIGHNCRFLQGPDREQPERYMIAEAVKNHLKITPLLDRKGRVIYYLGVQYDVTYKVNAKNEIEELNSLLEQISNNNSSN
jgi:PAS domain S-box-containing protein